MAYEHDLIANGISLATRTWPSEHSSRRPVVLLAGTGATARDWDTVADDLCRDRIVHAVNLRGHGTSSWPGRYSIEAMAADIIGLLPQLAFDLDVIGHSLGGLVACRAAVAAGTPIRRLVLEDVGVLHPRDPTAPTRPEGRLDFDWEMVQQIRPEIDAPDTSWTRILQEISVPTLAISGGETSFVPAEHIRELTESVADGTFTTIDAGHLIHENAPEEFVRAVRTHLDIPHH
ncbi:alpha/beta hydrolase [Allobranchiibius sp. GilTou38]|uniref:alpha/beta fold hydrolase n=1 Tax=Allobranchiibius sp. GilTou38 TaxID=2815210 RepID=UPI00326104FD